MLCLGARLCYGGIASTAERNLDRDEEAIDSER
jgi:hypothetical protein